MKEKNRREFIKKYQHNMYIIIFQGIIIVVFDLLFLKAASLSTLSFLSKLVTVNDMNITIYMAAIVITIFILSILVIKLIFSLILAGIYFTQKNNNL